MGVVISVNPGAPPLHGTDLLWIPGMSSEREWSVSWSLHAWYCHPNERRMSVKPGAGNGIKQTNRSSVSAMLTLNLFPTILFLHDLGIVAEGGAMMSQVTCLGVRLYSSLHVCSLLRIRQGTCLRKGGKLVTTRKTCVASRHAKQRLETELL